MTQFSKPRQGFTLIELLVVVVIIGILAGVGIQGFGAAQDRSRNSSMITNVRTTFLGIENWRADNGGAAVPAELVGSDPTLNVASSAANPPSTWPRYLPGGQLPKAPWCSKPQISTESAFENANAINNPWFSAIKTAADGDTLAIRQDNSFADGPIPTGGVAEAPSERKHYGFIYYVGNVNNGRYAVLGVGKRNREARVFSVRTNFQ